jgi:hypothetical protein
MYSIWPMSWYTSIGIFMYVLCPRGQEHTDYVGREMAMLSWIWGAHSGEYEGRHILESNTIQSSRSPPTFRRTVLTPSSGSKSKPIKLAALKRLVAGFPPRRPRFDPVSGQVGFVVDKVALGLFYSEYFGFPCQSLFYRIILHPHNHPGQAQ